MAGMLPGVESARIRRLHQSNLSNGTRRSSLCLYTSNYQELNINSPSSTERKGGGYDDDDKLDAVAREAKERLDHRFQTHLKSEIKRKQKGEKDEPLWKGWMKS